MLHALGWEVLHASAVLGPAGPVAFCGRSGTGKSTTAFGLSRRGYSLCADDVVCFDATPDTATAHFVPFTLRLEPSAVDFFGVGRDNGGLVAGRTEPGPTSRPFAALYVLERTAGRQVGPAIQIAPLSTADAFPAVLAHAHFLTLSDRDRSRTMIQHYLDLTSHVPVFSVRFRPEFGRLPDLLDRLEDSFAA